MRIAFESDLLLPPITEAFSILTDGAKVCVEDILYDKANGIVEITLQRKELKGFRTSSLGEKKPVYGQNTVKSLLKIRQVEEMKLEVDDRLVTECHSCFTVLLGLKVDSCQLYLGSVEEMRGESLCQVFIKINKLSIEYSDDVDSQS